MKELGRQIVHILFSIVVMAVVLVFGRIETMIMLSAGLILGSVLINLKMLKKKIPVIDGIVNIFERNETRFVGYGSAWFVAGCLLSVTFLSDINQILSVIWILGIGDGLSTIIGRNGKHKIPYNKKKSIAGTITFFLVSLPTYFLVGIYAVPLAFVCTIAESLDLPVDDNASIPIAGIIFLSLAM